MARTADQERERRSRAKEVAERVFYGTTLYREPCANCGLPIVSVDTLRWYHLAEPRRSGRSITHIIENDLHRRCWDAAIRNIASYGRDVFSPHDPVFAFERIRNCMLGANTLTATPESE